MLKLTLCCLSESYTVFVVIEVDGICAHKYISHQNDIFEYCWPVTGLDGKVTFGFASLFNLEDVLLWSELVCSSVNDESNVGVGADV